MSRLSKDINPDRSVRQILDLLAEYDSTHPAALIHAYRQNSASVRIRIIDPDFQGRDRVERERNIWNILGKLPDDVQNEITLLLLLTPDEAGFSFTNFEFDNPIPSHL